MLKHYLYRHIRLDKNEPFYIGIGTKQYNNPSSMSSEYRRAFSKYKRNKIWHDIVVKSDYEVEILLESDDYEFIKKKETEFVKLYGRKNLNTGTLSNLTDGGDGNLGWVPSEETKKLWSEQRKITHSGENHPMYGKKMSQEHKDNLSKAKKGKNAGEKNHMFGKTGELHPCYGIRGEAHHSFGKEFSKERKEQISIQTRGGNNPAARRAINTLTREIYDCGKDASEIANINHRHFCRMLNGDRKNTTYFVWLENYEGKIKYPEILDKGYSVKHKITGEVFESINKAAKAYGLNYSSLHSKVFSKKNDSDFFLLQ